jgi:hypothetical protein
MSSWTIKFVPVNFYAKFALIWNTRRTANCCIPYYHTVYGMRQCMVCSQIYLKHQRSITQNRRPRTRVPFTARYNCRYTINIKTTRPARNLNSLLSYPDFQTNGRTHLPKKY